MKYSTRLGKSPRKERIPPFVVFIDTETQSKGDVVQTLHFVLACYEIWAVDERGLPIHCLKKGVVDTEAAFYRLIGQYLPSRIVAHNWRFDAAVLRLGAKDNLERYGYTIDVSKSIIPVHSKGYSPFLLTLNWQGSRIEVLCSTNFYRMPLDAIGQSFGYPKGAMPTDTDAPDYLERLIAYCKRDVEILRLAYFHMFEFTQEIAGETPGLTLAMCSMRVFRKAYLGDYQVQGTRHIEQVTTAEIEAYKGGRTDAFYRGKPLCEQVFKYDVNSLYPSVMLGDMPIRYLQKVGTDLLMREMVYADTRHLYLVDATLSIPPDAPNAFLGGEGVMTDKGLVFPVGEYRTWLWQPMFTSLWREGWIKKVHKVYGYDKAPIFTDYILDMYDRRKAYREAGDGSRTLLVKLLMNSLYGKFGQKSYADWISISGTQEANILQQDGEGIERFTEYWEGVQGEYLQIAGDMWKGEAEKTAPAAASVMSIAGYITSAARVVLRDAMVWILNQYGGEVYYCDTDSIFCNMPLPADIVSTTELGKWKLEGVYPADEVNFTAPKHYDLAGERTLKGIRNPDAWDERGYRQEVFPNFMTDLTSKNPKRRKRLTEKAFIATIYKNPSGYNNKREIQGENAFTAPLVF